MTQPPHPLDYRPHTGRSSVCARTLEPPSTSTRASICIATTGPNWAGFAAPAPPSPTPLRPLGHATPCPAPCERPNASGILPRASPPPEHAEEKLPGVVDRHHCGIATAAVRAVLPGE